MTVLSCKGLTAGYGRMTVVTAVDLETQEGELVALLGPNGAGKTTTLRAISGLLTATGGSVEFAGTRIERMRPQHIARLGMAHVLEGRGLFPAMTVRENLMLGAYHKPVWREASSSLKTVLELFPALERDLERPAASLSGGQQQMLALGRAIMQRPRLLLVDEPSLGLAPVVVEGVFKALRRIKEQGTAILLAEQNVHLALQNADTAYVLEQGRIAFTGTGRELLSSPRIQESYLGMSETGDGRIYLLPEAGASAPG